MIFGLVLAIVFPEGSENSNPNLEIRDPDVVELNDTNRLEAVVAVFLVLG